MVAIREKEVTAVQYIASEDKVHFHVNAFEKGDTLLDTFTFTNEDAARAHAKALGAEKFDKEGWWRAK